MMRPKITVIDPGMGNLRSVCRAWEHAGAEVVLAASPDGVEETDALVFPGQGGMPHCMQFLNDSGWGQTMKDWIAVDRPFFGICLGLQALFEHSEEGDTPCLGIFPGRVQRFCLGSDYKIPHMGWNAVSFLGQRDHLTTGLDRERDQFYFVHSYHVVAAEAAVVTSTCWHGINVTASIQFRNIFGVQFHPESV
ncbi:MAG: imidazole glycerol phosphate synthase subunit HisH, partial [Verrucomicrobiota bacterium]